MSDLAVTVCVPVFNGETFLPACLRSIADQTYTGFSAHVVDDCSSDASMTVAETFSQGDPRFSVSRNRANLGLVGNWNRCLELAHGRWVKFVFQDDFIAPTCIEKLVRAAEATNAALTFCFREFAFEGGVADARREAYLDGRSQAEALFGDHRQMTPEEFCRIALPRLDRNFLGEPTAVLLRRDVFEDVGMFNPMLAVSCDSEFWLRVGIQYGVTCVPERLATFRVHDKSVSSREDSARGYTVDVLDAVITLHDIVFAAHYAPLRAEAARTGIVLQEQFARKAAWAYRMARSAQQNGDNSLMQQWNAVAVRLPKLRSFELRRGVRQLATRLMGSRWFGSNA